MSGRPGDGPEELVLIRISAMRLPPAGDFNRSTLTYECTLSPVGQVAACPDFFNPEKTRKEKRRRTGKIMCRCMTTLLQVILAVALFHVNDKINATLGDNGLY